MLKNLVSYSFHLVTLVCFNALYIFQCILSTPNIWGILALEWALLTGLGKSMFLLSLKLSGVSPVLFPLCQIFTSIFCQVIPWHAILSQSLCHVTCILHNAMHLTWRFTLGLFGVSMFRGSHHDIILSGTGDFNAVREHSIVNFGHNDHRSKISGNLGAISPRPLSLRGNATA